MFCEDRNNVFNNKLKKIRHEGYFPFPFILKNKLDENSSFFYEKFFIGIFGRLDQKDGTLTNLTIGGDGASGYTFTEEQRKHQSSIAKERIGIKNPFYGKKHTQETIEKIVKTLKKNYSQDDSYWKSEEYKNKMRIATFGEKNGFYNKNHTETTKSLLSKSSKDNWKSGKYEDMVKNKIGKPLSEEHKKSISFGLKGVMVKDKNPMYNKKHTEETKSKISENIKLKWQDVEYRKSVIDKRINRKVSDEQKQKASVSNIGKNLGKKKINKNGIEKSVSKEELDLYLNNGWILGCKKKGEKNEN